MVASITRSGSPTRFTWCASPAAAWIRSAAAVKNQTLGHRGRKRDPLYRIRKLMLKGAERLDGTALDRMLLGMRAGDPADEVLGAWLAKESVRDAYLTEHPDDAELLLYKAIEGCRLDSVPELRSLGRTLVRWRAEILDH